MGECCSKLCPPEEDKIYADQDATERSRLLGNPVSNNTARPITTDPYSANNPHTEARKGDEQSALNRILHQTATDVIDVAAIDSHSMEQHDIMDRARQYSNKLAMLCNKPNGVRPPSILPNGVSVPQQILAAPPISLADIQLITTAAERTSKALKEVAVRHKEDLVVPFGVP